MCVFSAGVYGVLDPMARNGLLDNGSQYYSQPTEGDLLELYKGSVSFPLLHGGTLALGIN